MKTIQVQIEDEAYRVLESWLGIGGVEKWLQHAINNKARKRVDASILEHTNRNPKKISLESKLTLLSTITLPTKKTNDVEDSLNLEGELK
jgi:hypothetical protein